MTDFPGPVLAFERRSRIRRKRFFELSIPSARWRIKNAWPSKGLVFVVGASKAAKTFFVLDATMRLSAGAEKIWGRRAKPCGTLYVGAEDAAGCELRALAWKQDKGRISPMPFDIIMHPISLLDDEWQDDLRAEIRLTTAEMAADGHDLGVLVFDTMSCSIEGGDENSSVDMSRALAALHKLADEFGLLVVVVAHFGKAGAQNGIRGWSGQTANADGVIDLERDKDDPDLRHVVFSKVKNGPDGGELAFRLKEVELAIDEDGDPVTSCVVQFEKVDPSKSLKKVKRASLTVPETTVLQAIKYVTDNGVTLDLPRSVIGAKPWQKAVTRDAVRERAVTAGLVEEGDKPEARRQRFKRALEGVCAKERARMEGDLIWLL